MDYKALCGLSDSDLARRDVAELNLRAANGLPGGRDLDIARCLETVDEWSQLVDSEIRRVWKRRARGDYAEMTGSQFRVLVMATVLQRHLGVRYNPDCMAGEYDATDARDHFIHGILMGRGGTCSSLPILYLAVGRRLGFPLHLVKAKEHLFVRWEGDGDRFNIETTARGFVSHDDQWYHSNPRPLTAQELRSSEYLRNQTPRQELACHIFQRGRCWADSLEFDEAVKAMFFAKDLHDIYRGDWMMLSMEKKMLFRMGNFKSAIPWNELLPTVAPLPRDTEHAWAIRTGAEDLLRIMKVRLAKCDTPATFFAKLAEKEPAYV